MSIFKKTTDVKDPVQRERKQYESTLLDYGDSTSAHNWIIVTLRCLSTYYIPNAVGHLLMTEPCAKKAIQKGN